MPNTHKFGVLSDSFLLKKWQLLAIQQLQNQGCSFELLVLNNRNSHIVKSDKTYQRNLKKNLFYRIFQKIFFKVPLLENCSAEFEFQNISTIYVDVVDESSYACHFKKEDIEFIKSKNLDFILRFGFNIIHGEALNAAKFGVWSFHHDDDEVIRGGPPGFWEIFENHSTNGIVLQQLTDELDKGNIIRKSKVEVIQHSYSTHVNELLKQGLHLLEFEISNLQTGKEFSTFPPSKIRGKLYKFPKNSVVLKFVWILLKNKFRFHFNELFRHENWNIGISNQTIQQFFESKSIKSKTWLDEKGKANFSADPFLCVYPPNKTYIVYENFDYKRYKGVINKVEVANEHEFLNDQVLIEKDFHLSFPYVMNSQNSNFVFPESQQNNKLTGYEFDSDFHLKSSRNYFENDLVDSVVFQFKDKFWLFGSLKKCNPNNHLFAFYSDSFDGKYFPHSLNPIKSDVCSSRMAGGFIEFQSQLYRPAQVNDEYYGKKIAMMKILELSENSFKEEIDFFINPPNDSKYKHGIHTINFTDKLIVFDAKNYKFVFVQFIRVLTRKFKSR